jgi:ATP-dependent RNA helicase SUPV3L1/SUV3
LWALKFGSPDLKGFDELQHLAASGRTSFPADKDVPKPLYRTVGYRVCGERAVRVDILERLADMVRPALAWREGASGIKPAGAVDGRSFMVTGAMTSLTGSSGEDFASILRSLGYRMEKRSKPAESLKPAEPSTVADTPIPALAEEGALASSTVDVAAGPASAEVLAAPSEAQLVPEPVAEEPDVAEPAVMVAEAAAEVQPIAEIVTEVSSVDGAASVAVESAAPRQAAAEEPQFIEVWRTGRPPEERIRRPRRPRRHAGKPAEGQAAEQVQATGLTPDSAAIADASPQPNTDGERKDRGPRRRRPDRDQASRGQAEGAERTARPVRDRSEHRARPDRGDRPKHEGRRDSRDRHERGDSNRPPRSWASTNERRGGKEPDPNSPFAKLAALKAQLESNKEQ